MAEPVDCPEWERYLPEKYICGTCDGRVRPLDDCEECGGTGLWLRAIGSARIGVLEAALREIIDMDDGFNGVQCSMAEAAAEALKGES